ncbi:MAG TPA: hypothetical protein VGI03_15695 [Verrucomicrobiae bacterium]|jgi:hypothetical protein
MNGFQKTHTWDFLKVLTIEQVQPVYSWQPIRELLKLSRQAIMPRVQERQNLESQWAVKLRPICGIKGDLEWSKFRPLRSSREEDWSDWLAWVLETSQAGVLAESLFGKYMNCEAKTFTTPEVNREVQIDNRRADVVAFWRTEQITHIEVKIWDRNFEKTFETARKLREIEPSGNWNDFILIPSESRESWIEAVKTFSGYGMHKIEVIFWDDVVRGLRKCLWNEHESILWRAWAWTFCNVIERKILGLRRLDKGPENSSPSEMQMTMRWLNVLNLNLEEIYE